MEIAMVEIARNRLTPWYVGLAVVVLTDLVTGYVFVTKACPAGIAPDVAVVLLVLVFGVLPAIYLVLMYLALKSQP
jgi:hypothetical protein